MRAYSYFLFRIYIFYRDIIREGNLRIFSSVSTVSSIFVSMNVFTLSEIISNYTLDAILIFPCMILTMVLNYYLFIKRRSFLDCNFKTDKKGGVLVVLCMLFTVALLILAASKKRSRIEQKHSETLQIDSTRGSLEKDIRDWLKKK